MTDGSVRGLLRRTFIGQGLILLGLGRRAWAQLAAGLPRYQPLASPAIVPLDAGDLPLRPVPFVARAVTSSSSPNPGQAVRLDGMVFRTPATGNEPGHLSAVCLTCPHDHCPVDFVTDPRLIAEMSGGKIAHPIFQCACHFSVFDPAKDGELVSGPAPRGLYRFSLTPTGPRTVRIDAVEEDALAW